MNKDDFTVTMLHVTHDHASQRLLRAIYGRALLDTVQTVGSEKLLDASLKDLNSKANKCAERDAGWGSRQHP